MKNLELVDRFLRMTTNLGANDDAHKNFWFKWKEQKQIKLFDLFKDQLIIEKEIEITKDLVFLKEDIMEVDLSGKILEVIHPEFKSAYARWDLSTWDREKKTGLERELVDLKYAMIKILSIHILANQVFDENFDFISPITQKTVKIQVGSKVSKALKHFIPDQDDLNSVQTLYSQILNDKYLKGTLCLSIHPMDYLTASVNDNGWSSCYDTKDKGCYCASTLCLNNSPNTFIAYLKSKSDMEISTWGSEDEITWNSKRWRTWVTLGKDNEVCHIGKHYPYYNKDLNEAVLNMVAELTNKTYNPIETNEGFVRITAPYNMYNDADGIKLYVGMTDKYKHGLAIYPAEIIDVSPSGSICPICGDYFEDVESDIVCGDCGDFDRCADCGCVVSDGDRIWIESEGIYVCDCCSSNYYYCEDCNEYFSDINEVRSYYNRSHRFYSTMHLCDSCLESRGDDIIECSCCGDLVKKEQAREDGTCFNCEESQVEVPID